MAECNNTPQGIEAMLEDALVDSIDELQFENQGASEKLEGVMVKIMNIFKRNEMGDDGRVSEQEKERLLYSIVQNVPPEFQEDIIEGLNEFLERLRNCDCGQENAMDELFSGIFMHFLFDRFIQFKPSLGDDSIHHNILSIKMCLDQIEESEYVGRLITKNTIFHREGENRLRFSVESGGEEITYIVTPFDLLRIEDDVSSENKMEAIRIKHEQDKLEILLEEYGSELRSINQDLLDQMEENKTKEGFEAMLDLPLSSREHTIISGIITVAEKYKELENQINNLLTRKLIDDKTGESIEEIENILLIDQKVYVRKYFSPDVESKILKEVIYGYRCVTEMIYGDDENVIETRNIGFFGSDSPRIRIEKMGNLASDSSEVTYLSEHYIEEYDYLGRLQQIKYPELKITVGFDNDGNPLFINENGVSKLYKRDLVGTFPIEFGDEVLSSDYLDMLAYELNTPERMDYYIKKYMLYKDDGSGFDLGSDSNNGVWQKKSVAFLDRIKKVIGVNSHLFHEDEYWQTPKETINRIENGKMRGDCDDYAFLAVDILRKQGKNAHAIVMSPAPDGEAGHMTAVWVEKRSDGNYDGYSMGTFGLHRNGLRIDSVTPGSDDGFRTVEDALNGVFSIFTNTKDFRNGTPYRVTDEVEIATIPSKGEKQIENVSIDIFKNNQ